MLLLGVGRKTLARYEITFILYVHVVAEKELKLLIL